MIAIIGKGIIGLSVAEYLSRDKSRRIVIFSSDQFPEASRAAAANLATKSQVYARDTHFELKLTGKKIYKQWLTSLCTESDIQHKVYLDDFYRNGLGRDVFESPQQAVRQWDRIKQPLSEIQSRGLPLQRLSLLDECTLEYGDEAWVNAGFLLDLLQNVLRARGVRFENVDVSELDAWKQAGSSLRAVIVCAGTQTPSLLRAWNLQASLPSSMNKRRRWSYGGTLCADIPHWNLPAEVALLDYQSPSPLGKLTVSGGCGQLFCSSVSLTCAEMVEESLPVQPNSEIIELQKQQMISVLRHKLGIDVERFAHQWRWGWRLGFGHSELVIDEVSHSLPDLTGPMIVVAGAHKSGFLFAPSIGSLVRQKLQGCVI